MHRCRDILEEILPTRVTRHLWTIPVELPLPFFTLCSTWKKVTLKLSRDWFVQLLAPVRYKTMTDFSRFSAFQKWKYCTFHIWYIPCVSSRFGYFSEKDEKKSGKFVYILAAFKQCRYHPSIWRIFLPKFFKMLRILQSNEDTPSIWRIFLTKY